MQVIMQNNASHQPKEFKSSSRKKFKLPKKFKLRKLRQFVGCTYTRIPI